MAHRIKLAAAVTAAATVVLVAAAQDAKVPIDKIKAAIVDRNPQTRLAKVDHERLAVRRLDVVDENGVIRMTLAAPTPAPIIDGIQYKRAFPVAGLVIFDKNGSERGGFGVADIEGSAVVLAQDHANFDAIGWRIMPDGSVSFAINERPSLERSPELDNRLLPGIGAASRIRMTVAADGAPSIALADKQDRPRVRLALTSEGYGAIEFLDAAGKIVETFAPEGRKAKQWA
jgi:hypothetical protein